ncbi:MAG TPA: DUF4251 domain-containing protein [Eudoraea sp.]|nr:DUF4251 domain-containing protein [Eudoraea sp.]
MKGNIKLILVVFAGVLSGCGSAPRTVAETADSRKLDAWVADRSFEIKADWASPLMTNSLNQIANAGLLPQGSGAGRINLIGNTNYVRVMGDSISVYLPYYGERQMGGGYNNMDAGIQLNGIPLEYEVLKDEVSLRHKIHFSMKQKSETIDVHVILFPNLTSSVNVNSSHRNPIRYDGDVSALSMK